MATNTASSHSALLLLPTPTSPNSLRTRFAPTLASVLPSLADSVKNSDHAARLDVGIVLPKTFSTRLSPRASVFPRVHDLVKDLYTLIGNVAAENGVGLDDGPGGVDARVVMFEDQSGHPADRPLVAHSYSGPIIDLSILVASGRHYDPVFCVDSDDGEKVLQQLLNRHGVHKISHPNIHRVTVGDESENKPISSGGGGTTQPIPALRKAKAAHKSVAVSGAFEHLDLTAKLLLTAAAVVVEPETDDILSPTRRHITIGITAGEGWDTRQARVADFFESIVAFAKHVQASRTVEKLNKPGGQKGISVRLGPTLTVDYVEVASDRDGGLVGADEGISALVVEKGSGAGAAQAVGDKVEVFEVDKVDAGS